MSGNSVLEWAILAISLCNVIMLLWLGVTVLLNAERRDGGVMLAICALITGAFFFLFHTVVISVGLDRVSPGIIARWPLAWVAGFVLPCAWYQVMLWFGGFYAQPHAVRHRLWHRVFLLGLGAMVALVLLSLLLMPFSPLQPYTPAALLAGPAFGDIPLLAVVYALLVFGCTGMAFDILLFPAPSSRLLGDLARRRSRAWLIAASLALLSVSLLLGGVLMRISPELLDREPGQLPYAIWLQLVWGDFFLTLLVGVAVVLLGQAIVIYELFTGITLPRHGLRQQWRTLVLTAAAFSVLMAFALVRQMPLVFSLLLTAAFLAISYALHNWRSHAARERFMSSLRPFIHGPRVTEALQPGAMPELTATLPFHALCEHVLGVRWACLTATGPFAALVIPVTYPGSAASTGIPTGLLARCTDPQTLCLPVAPGECDHATWAVPLWSTRGLIGVLLLGEKVNGGLFTQEEIEVARATGERLIDTLAGAQIARRLMQVQRSRLTEDQLADRRTRRVIHDDILPQIHTTMLALSAEPAQAATVTQLAEIHHALAAMLRELPTTTVLDITHHGVIGAVRAQIERNHAGAFNAVEWSINPTAEARINALTPPVAEILYGAACEAIRNAARYGQGEDPARPLTLTITLTDAVPLALTIADNGVGVAHATPSVGSGQGILLHSAMMAIIGGAWNADSTPGKGTRVTLTIPEE